MKQRTKKLIIISGINCTEAGILSTLKCIMNEANKDNNYKVIAFVHKKNLFNYRKIKLIEIPRSKKSWFIRIWYEYIVFKKISLRLKPNTWISMHDTTPNVKSDKIFTYCHNASPFYKEKLKSFKYDKKFFLFNLFYKYLYRINIKKATAIIVQQQWLKEEFEILFKIKNILVAKPEKTTSENRAQKTNKESRKKIFFFPSYPRFFKNFEVIFEAAKILNKNSNNNEKFEIIITIDGRENKYSKELKEKYKNIKNINFHGRMEKEDVLKTYEITDCLIFPSKLESWGLPLSEFKAYGRQILVANLPYARETIGDYEKTAMFDPDNKKELAALMQKIINNEVIYKNFDFIKKNNNEIEGWENLWNKIK